MVTLVRSDGFVPASAGAQATWRAARERHRWRVPPPAADLRRARDILAWARGLHPRDPHGYRGRLHNCLVADRLRPEDLPLAASAVRAFNMHLYHEIRGRRRRAVDADRAANMPRA